MIGFKVTNRAKTKLYADIPTTTQTFMDITPWTQWLFPSTYPFELIIEQKSGKIVLKSEIVLVTWSPIANRFTITRAYEACPVSDESVTQTTTAQTFSAWASVTLMFTSKMYEDLRDELALKMNTVWGLGSGYGINKTKYIDPTTGNEVLKDTSAGSSIPSTAITEFRDGTTGNGIRVPYSLIQADMSLWGGGSVNIPTYESTIVVWDQVGLIDNSIYKCTTENKSMTAISTTVTAVHGQVEISANKFAFFYSNGITLYARIGTLANDVMTYGTEVTVDTLVTWPCTGGIAKIGTDKFILVYADNTVTGTTRHRACTVSGTTITLGTTATQVHVASNSIIVGVCRVRDDAYATVYSNTGLSNFSAKVHTVSGTTVTVNASSIWAYGNNANVNIEFLDTNRIGFSWSYYNGTSNVIVSYIWEISGTTVSTTYTNTITLGSNGWRVYVARTGIDSFVLTMEFVSSGVFLIAKPSVGTTITHELLVDVWVFNLPVIPLFGNCYSVMNGTTLSVYQEKELLGTITGITGFSIPVTQLSSQDLSAGRYVYMSGNTPRIINFASVFYFGIATTLTWSVLLRGSITKTGVVAGLRYYLQADGTIWTRKREKYVGKWINTNTLLLW